MIIFARQLGHENIRFFDNLLKPIFYALHVENVPASKGASFIANWKSLLVNGANVKGEPWAVNQINKSHLSASRSFSAIHYNGLR